MASQKITPHCISYQIRLLVMLNFYIHLFCLGFISGVEIFDFFQFSSLLAPLNFIPQTIKLDLTYVMFSLKKGWKFESVYENLSFLDHRISALNWSDWLHQSFLAFAFFSWNRTRSKFHYWAACIAQNKSVRKEDSSNDYQKKSLAQGRGKNEYLIWH